MATTVQRWQAIGDALLNRAATQSELTRLGLAIAKQGPDLAAYNAMSNSSKAEYVLAYLRRHLLHLVKDTEAATAVAQARDTTAAAVSADFAETP